MLEARLANHLDARVGDVIEVEFLQRDDTRHEVVLTGTVQTFFGLGAYMDQDKLAAMLGQVPQVTLANVMIDEAMEDALYQAVKDAPGLSGITLMTQVRKSFDETMAESAWISVWIFTVVASLIAVGVVYNSARILLSRTRAASSRSLRILGFTRGEVSYILLGELFILDRGGDPARHVARLHAWPPAWSRASTAISIRSRSSSPRRHISAQRWSWPARPSPRR